MNRFDTIRGNGALTALLLAGCFALTGCSGSGSTDVDDDEDLDRTPPGAITDLRVEDETPTSLTLRWTATGDDGAAGFAASYDLRGSEEPITAGNFDAGIAITPDHPPLPPGTTEEMVIEPLQEGHTYYFALKAQDDAGNVGGLSNCAHGTCPVDAVVEIPDGILLQLVRDTLDMPSGDLHLTDLLRLEELEGNDLGIADLTGLEAATHLRVAHLMNNEIEDASPLGGLMELQSVSLTDNQLTDISSLQGLTAMMYFSCGGNQLADVSAVEGMTHLRILSLYSNPLTSLPDLSALVELREIGVSFLGLTDLDLLDGVTSLEAVFATGNEISDITALAALPNLYEVYLPYNQIADLASLVSNAGLSEGDFLDVRENPLSQKALDEQIPALVARGVSVEY